MSLFQRKPDLNKLSLCCARIILSSCNLYRKIAKKWVSKKQFCMCFPIPTETIFQIIFNPFCLDKREQLKLYPALEKVQRKKGSKFSIICTTERMRYYSRDFDWFKENGILPNTTNVVRHSTFLRLDFASLKVEETGIYKCNVSDDPSLGFKRFQLVVFGTWFQYSWHGYPNHTFWSINATTC